MQHDIPVSALLSVYKNDNPEVLEASLRSLFGQQVKADEIVVVQEGDVPASVEAVLGRWQDIARHSAFRWLKIPFQNGPLGYGLPASLNFGIREATGTYVARVDSDDIYLPHWMSRYKDFLKENPDIDLVGCSILEVDESGRRELGKRLTPCCEERIRRLAKWRNPFNGMTVVFRRDMALRLGGTPLWQATRTTVSGPSS